MEFTGRVKQLLPLREGVSQRTGNAWKALPFIFEYFENENDRYADSVLLETFDENVIKNLKENMEVRCGFCHRTREYEGKIYNEVRLYKINAVRGVTTQPEPTQASSTTTTQQPSQAKPQETPVDGDDLPF